jgi:hypothetical protein
MSMNAHIRWNLQPAINQEAGVRVYDPYTAYTAYMVQVTEHGVSGLPTPIVIDSCLSELMMTLDLVN